MLRLRSCRHHVVDSLTRDSFDCDRDRVWSSVRCPQSVQRERSPLPPRRRRAQRRHYSQQQLPQGCSGRRPQVQLAQARCRRRSCKRSMEPPMMTSCGSAPSSVSSSSRRIGAAAEPPQPLRLRLRRLLRRLHLLLRVSPTTTSSLTARAFQTSMMSWAGGVARVYEGSQETVCRQQGARARPTCARECRRSNYEVTVFGLSPGRV